MGRFVNSGNSAFQVALNSEIYVDKTGLLAKADVSNENAIRPPERIGHITGNPEKAAFL